MIINLPMATRLGEVDPQLLTSIHSQMSEQYALEKITIEGDVAKTIMSGVEGREPSGNYPLFNEALALLYPLGKAEFPNVNDFGLIVRRDLVPHRRSRANANWHKNEHVILANWGPLRTQFLHGYMEVEVQPTPVELQRLVRDRDYIAGLETVKIEEAAENEAIAIRRENIHRSVINTDEDVKDLLLVTLVPITGRYRV